MFYAIVPVYVLQTVLLFLNMLLVFWSFIVFNKWNEILSLTFMCLNNNASYNGVCDNSPFALYWIGLYPTKRIDYDLAYQQSSSASPPTTLKNITRMSRGLV